MDRVVSLSVLVVDGSSLEVIDCCHPFVPNLRGLRSESDFSAPGFLVGTVLMHGHGEAEGVLQPIEKSRFFVCVDERQLYVSLVVVLCNLFRVVFVPLET